MPEERKEVTLRITLKADGSLDVTGPIHNKLLSLGMLELAKDLVINFKPMPETSRIISATQIPKVN